LNFPCYTYLKLKRANVPNKQVWGVGVTVVQKKRNNVALIELQTKPKLLH